MIRFLKNNWLKIVAVIAVIFIGFSVYNRGRIAKLESQETYFNPAKDKTVSPEVKDIKDQITLAGSISASEVAVLRFQNPGKLVWIGVKEGDTVKKYQAIASLDKEQLRKNLQTQFNNYRTQLSQFQDVQDQYQLTKDKVLVTDTIQRILDRTQYSLDNSVINYEITDMAIKESNLYSPISGVVTAIDQPLTGTNITPANASFTIINPQSIYFKSDIDQEEVTKLKVGQKAAITIDSYPDSTFESEITYISFVPVAGQSSTVYQVRFSLPVSNNDQLFRLGMDGDSVIFIGESLQAVTVPLDSLYDDNGQSYVLVKTDTGLERRFVTTGIETDTDVEITKGLSTNETVVIKNR